MSAAQKKKQVSQKKNHGEDRASEDKKQVTQRSEYDHPYEIDEVKSDKLDSSYAKKMAKRSQGNTFCTSKLAESNGAKFSVEDPNTSLMCNSFNGRIVKILSELAPSKIERLGEKAANVITLSTLKFLEDILRVLVETAVSDSIKQGSASQKSKVIKHWNLTSILKNHPALKKYGFRLLDKIQTRVKVPEKNGHNATQSKAINNKKVKQEKEEQKKDLKKTLPKGKGKVRKTKS